MLGFNSELKFQFIFLITKGSKRNVKNIRTKEKWQKLLAAGAAAIATIAVAGLATTGKIEKQYIPQDDMTKEFYSSGKPKSIYGKRQIKGADIPAIFKIE